MSGMSCISAVIFDVDGLMIDTERIFFQMIQQVLGERGIPFGEEHMEPLLGLDHRETADYVIALTGITDSPAEFNEAYLSRFYKVLDNHLEPNPGLGELVADLRRRGLPLGVASNSGTAYLRRVLKALGFGQDFQALAGRDQVSSGKPAPDVYLLAAAQLGVDPQACLAVEDSPVGMRAALAAGMHCAVVGEWVDRPAFAPATVRFASLPAMHAALDELLCWDEPQINTDGHR